MLLCSDYVAQTLLYVLLQNAMPDVANRVQQHRQLARVVPRHVDEDFASPREDT
jgi:hypothetical protein